MYADRDELFKRKPADVILDAVDREGVGEWNPIAEDRVDTALQDATDLMDSHLGKRYALPISPVPRYLVKVCADIAYYNCLSFRGFREGTADDTVVRDRDNAVKWLEQVGAGKAVIPADDGTPLPPNASPSEGGAVSQAGGAEVESAPPMFSRDRLKGF